MEEKLYEEIVGIMETLDNACQSSNDFPITVIFHEKEENKIIPIPAHAAPAVVASIAKQVMRDFLRFPGVEKMLTKEQISTLQRCFENSETPPSNDVN